jgi:Glycosyltransferases involved in cell wall biogenesis
LILVFLISDAYQKKLSGEPPTYLKLKCVEAYQMVSIQDPKVSIGLPVFNGEKYLREAIDSILAQTFTDFELIISDNASTDRTEEICKEYEAKDPRVRYYRNELNLGAAPNYNRLVELSRGEYFKWACHDDLCAPEFLEKCVEILEQNSPIILCYTRTLIIDENGKPILDDFGDDLNLQMPKPHERYGRYHEALFCSGPKGCDRTRVLYG